MDARYSLQLRCEIVRRRPVHDHDPRDTAVSHKVKAVAPPEPRPDHGRAPRLLDARGAGGYPMNTPGPPVTTDYSLQGHDV
eukprot:5008767-Prymnesium_polylepis.2